MKTKPPSLLFVGLLAIMCVLVRWHDSAWLGQQVIQLFLVKHSPNTGMVSGGAVDSLPQMDSSDDEEFEPQSELDERVGVFAGTGTSRSSAWESVRDDYFAAHPRCAFKGCCSRGPFNVHHIRPFHLHPELELDPTNLITLCRGGANHHLYVGHNGSFKEENPHVVEDCRKGVIPKIGFQRMQVHAAKIAKTLQSP